MEIRMSGVGLEGHQRLSTKTGSAVRNYGSSLLNATIHGSFVLLGWPDRNHFDECIHSRTKYQASTMKLFWFEQSSR